MSRICLWERKLPRCVLRGGRVCRLVRPGELSRTHIDILYGNATSGWGMIHYAGPAAQSRVANSGRAPGHDAAWIGQR